MVRAPGMQELLCRGPQVHMTILLTSGELVKDWPGGGGRRGQAGKAGKSLPSSGGSSTGTYATTAECLLADENRLGMLGVTLKDSIEKQPYFFACPYLC